MSKDLRDTKSHQRVDNKCLMWILSTVKIMLCISNHVEIYVLSHGRAVFNILRKT